MSSTRTDEQSKEMETCKNRASFFKQITDEQCRIMPFHGTTPTFKLLHNDVEACSQASQTLINQLVQCELLLTSSTESSLKPK